MSNPVIQLLLMPFALLYGLGVSLRNMAYDTGIFKSRNFPIPIVCIGNLSTGGTGKTPHTEYLIRLLKDHYRLATLSRGYKRKSEGFVLAEEGHSHEMIGDEPKQFFSKFPDIKVAVDADRVNGVEQLLQKFGDLDIVLLDDAFQHRAIKAEFSILLTPYNDLYIKDKLLPMGNLREWRSGSKRADIIIVSKCPRVMSPLDKRAIRQDLKPKNYQQVYFSYLEYGDLVYTFNPEKQIKLNSVNKIYLFTGIANSTELSSLVKENTHEFTHKSFPDHHNFGDADITSIIKEFEAFSVNSNAILLTTEKDFMRIKDTPLMERFKHLPLFYIPIQVCFHGSDGEELNTQILEYVRKNQIHRNVSSGKSAQ